MRRLTYANVMSSIAVFLVLGGATAFAAGNLGKNSVGTKQLKSGAVTGAKIKNGSVTGAKLKLATIGQVPSAASADVATAAKTAVAAQTATSANSAKSAESAKIATSAGNADTVAGSTVRRFFFAAEAGTPARPILQLDGLTLTAACNGGGQPILIATTSTSAFIHDATTVSGVPSYTEADEFSPGEELDLLTGGVDSLQGNFTYARPDGTVLTATFASEEDAFEPTAECLIVGNAVG